MSTEQGQRNRSDLGADSANSANSAESAESAVHGAGCAPAQAAGLAAGASDPLAPTSSAREGWRSLLSGMSPRETLARLLQGDPLELRRVVSRRLSERAYLFDADRVHLRTLAHCARYAVRYRGSPPLDQWLTQIVDQALLDLLREDVEAQRRAEPADPQEHAALIHLALPLGLEPKAMRRVCLAHNLLREPERRAFHALVIRGRSLEQVARECDASAVEVARRARRGLEAILLAAERSNEAAICGGAQDADSEPAREMPVTTGEVPQ